MAGKGELLPSPILRIMDERLMLPQQRTSE
jgi:hypothetical protein